MKLYYSKNGITIYHGDCLEIIPKLQESVGLVFTDPPYGIGKEGITNDDLQRCEYKQWMRLVLSEIDKVSNDGYFIYNNEAMFFKLAEIYEDCRVFASCNNFSVMGRGMPYAWSPIVFKIKNKDSWVGRGRNWFISNTASMKHTPKRIGHPSPKPLDVVTYIIKMFDSKIILDPFVGSGTTLRAAKDLNRKAIGIEIEEKYCEIAAKRLSQEVLPFGTSTNKKGMEKVI